MIEPDLRVLEGGRRRDPPAALKLLVWIVLAFAGWGFVLTLALAVKVLFG